MHPVLYDSTETSFTSNGLGMLSECTKCVVTEERNGIYECEFSIPITAKHFTDIDINKIVFAPHDDSNDRQPFVIYRKSAPIDGIVTFNAHHVSYGLNNVIIPPMEHSGVVATFEAFEDDAITNNPFTFYTAKSSAGTFTTDVPASIRSVLWGSEGSVLDVFGGGEFEFDKYTVKLYQHRGADTGVTIRYGKNLTKLEQELDNSGTYNAVIPFWLNSEDGTLVQGNLVQGTDSGTVIKPVALDMSDQFENQPTTAQLEAAALTFLNANTPWVPKENIEIDFVALWQTDEYKDIAVLERVKLCDTVSVYYPALGVTAKAQVIRTEYDVLAERYSKMEIGDAKSTYADVLTSAIEDKTLEQVAKGISTMEQALDHATQLITGGLGGHVVIGTDVNGKPQEILIMDTESTLTAQQVLRINVNGIGFSSNGINGPYDTAWTLDGVFSANWITTGYLSCNRIKGGILTLGGSQNGDGYIIINDASDDLIARIDKDGIIAHSLTADDYVYVYGSGGSRIYTPANVENVTLQDPTDPAYVDLSNRGLTIQAQRPSALLPEDGTLKTVYPADAEMTYEAYREGDIVEIDTDGVVSASTETGDYGDEAVDHRGFCTYVLNQYGAPVPGGEWFTFDTSTTEATENKSYVYNLVNKADGIQIDDTDITRWTAEYTVPATGSPIDNWYFRLDESEYTHKSLNLTPTHLQLSYTKDTPSTTQAEERDITTDSFYMDVMEHTVQIGGDSTWTFELNGTNMSKMAEAYPTQAGMRGTPAIRVESGMCKYMAFGVNPTTKQLFVYGSDNADNLSYIGKVTLT